MHCIQVELPVEGQTNLFRFAMRITLPREVLNKRWEDEREMGVRIGRKKNARAMQ